ncbi:MAG TPA: hypothetical protein VJH03_08100 [Blastocatellia bacterium]|nr:hypothetical protein [Blastocatellia bacterium]
MIELQREGEPHLPTYLLKVNGQVISKAIGIGEKLPEEFVIESKQSNKLLTNCSFSELLPNVHKIVLSDGYYIEPVNIGIEIYTEEQDKQLIGLRITPVMGEWIFPFTPLTFLEEVESVVQNRFAQVRIIKEENWVFTLILLFAENDSDTIIKSTIRDSTESLREILDQAITACLERSKGKSLATYFSFPEEIKAACEQYLLYFGEFLRDVGNQRIS